MAWWYKPFPGFGPWSHLPPHLRLWFRDYPSTLPTPPWLSREDEIKYLEELKKYISEVVLKEIDKRLEELKSGK
jgi:hypothetical protein